MIRFSNARLGLALFLLLGLSVAATANEVTGTIRSINKDKKEVVLKGILNDTTYEVGKDARVCLDGKKADLGQLREGDHVALDVQKQGQRMIAQEVRALRKAAETIGTIRGVNPDKRQVVLKGLLADTTYQMQKGATIWIDGRQGKLSGLHEGNHVRITYERVGDQLAVSEVRLLRK